MASVVSVANVANCSCCTADAAATGCQCCKCWRAASSTKLQLQIEKDYIVNCCCSWSWPVVKLPKLFIKTLMSLKRILKVGNVRRSRGWIGLMSRSISWYLWDLGECGASGGHNVECMLQDPIKQSCAAFHCCRPDWNTETWHILESAWLGNNNLNERDRAQNQKVGRKSEAIPHICR